MPAQYSQIGGPTQFLDAVEYNKWKNSLGPTASSAGNPVPQQYLDAMQYNKTPEELEADKIRKRFAGYALKPIESVAKEGPTEIRDILAKRQAALAGYNAPQLEQMKSQLAATQQASQNQRQRQLLSALARQGIKGGAAAALQAQQGQQAAKEQALMDQELMLKQSQRQQEALDEYQKGVLGSLDLANKRQFADLATQLAGESSITAREIAKKEAEAQKYYAEMMRAANKD